MGLLSKRSFFSFAFSNRCDSTRKRRGEQTKIYLVRALSVEHTYILSLLASLHREINSFLSRFFYRLLPDDSLVVYMHTTTATKRNASNKIETKKSYVSARCVRFEQINPPMKLQIYMHIDTRTTNNMQARLFFFSFTFSYI
jgi:hypothetical protein